MDLVIEATLWTILATVISQVVTLFFLWMLGLKPQRLAHEIENVQNTAVGAMFFIISLIVAMFVSVVSSAGFSSDTFDAETLAWTFGGALGAVVYTAILFWIAHYLLEPLEGEGLVGYLQRELIAEQNAALAFFLGGLAVAPFLAVLFQII